MTTIHPNLDTHTALIIADFAEQMAEWCESHLDEPTNRESAIIFKSRAEAFWMVRGYIHDALYVEDEQEKENEQVES